MTKIHLERRIEGIFMKLSSASPEVFGRIVGLLKQTIPASHRRYLPSTKQWLLDPLADALLDDFLEAAEGLGASIQWSFAPCEYRQPAAQRQPEPADAHAVLYFRFFGRSSRSTETH